MGGGIFENNCFYEKSNVYASNMPTGFGNINADPKLQNPGSGTAGLDSLTGYKLQQNSPCINAGKVVNGMGDKDFFGGDLYYGTSPDIGVHEYPSGEQKTVPVNIAAGKPATASNVISSSYTANKATDTLYSTRWATSDDTRACWIEIDFGAPATFNQVITTEFQYNGFRVQAYSIQYWNGTVWVDAYTGGSIGANKKDSFPAVTGTKMRLNITSASFAPSIREIEVYYLPEMVIVPAASAKVKVDLTPYFNADGFSYDTARNNGNYDNHGYTYSADLAGSNISLNGTDYQMGSYVNNSNNVINCAGQTIPLTQNKYSSVNLLSSATDGDKTGTFRINYTDATYTDVNVTMRDWCGSTTGQNVAKTMAHRHSPTEDNHTTNHIFAYYLAADPAKTVQSITLPNNSTMHVMAMTLIPAPVQIDLNSYFNNDGFSYDTARSDGNYDNSGYTYSSELAGNSISYDGCIYNLGSLMDGAKNVVNCTGQTISLNDGNTVTESIRLLGSATGGDKAGIFRINYADGTYSDVNISMKDWCGSTTGQNIAKTMAHRHSPAADSPQTNHIFAYYLIPDTGKAVQSITVPNNPGMHILAITTIIK